MLTKRIIPTFLKRGNSLVKGQQFQSWRSVGHAIQAVKIYQARGIDELIFLDIGATFGGEGPDIEAVKKLADICFMPLTYGGGIRNMVDIKAVLFAGADKVAINSAAMENRDLIRDASRLFGRQAIVASIDYRDDGLVYTHCGNKVHPIDTVSWAMALEELGAGEILLTSIDREGTMEGYDLEMLKYVSEAVSIPVIASGGCGDYVDMQKAISSGASAVGVGSLFQFTDATPLEAAKYLAREGIEVRL